MVLGCGCGVELVVCVSVVRVWLCFGAVVWFFDAVFGWAFGCQRACGVCSRLLEMADVSGFAGAAKPHAKLASQSSILILAIITVLYAKYRHVLLIVHRPPIY